MNYSTHEKCEKLLEIIDNNSTKFTDDDYMKLCDGLHTIYTNTLKVEERPRWFAHHIIKGFLNFTESREGKPLSGRVFDNISESRAWDIMMASHQFTKTLLKRADKWNKHTVVIRNQFPSCDINLEHYRYKYTCQSCGFIAYRKNMVHEPHKSVHLGCEHSGMECTRNSQWECLWPEYRE